MSDFLDELAELPKGEKGTYNPALDGSNRIVKSPLQIAIDALANLDSQKLMDDDELGVLDKTRREMQTKLNEVMAAMQAIEDRRFYYRARRLKAENAVKTEEMLDREAKRNERMQEEKLQSFEMLQQFAKDSSFYWYSYAMKHQWDAALQMATSGSTLLADGMGLGKTLTSIMTADLSQAKRVLVVAPADMTNTFADEFKMWSPGRTVISAKSASLGTKQFLMEHILSDPEEEFVLVVNYETLWEAGRGKPSGFVEALADAEFDIVYADEAHTMKNIKGLSFEKISAIRANAHSCIPISGTFILNAPVDLFANLHLVDPEAFPLEDKNVFLRSYCQQNVFSGKWEFKVGGEKSLLTRLGGRIIRRVLADTDIILPEQFVHEVLIPLNELHSEQVSIIDQLNKFAELVLDELDENGEPKSLSIAAQIALITRQRQAAVWPGGIKVKDEFDNIIFDVSKETTESIKMDYAVKLMSKRIDDGHRTVVFSQFKTALDELNSRMTAKGYRIAQFDGSTKDKERGIIKRDFLRPQNGEHKADYLFDAVLANYKTGGVGLTFTEATYMLILDEEWNPGKAEQAYARICRIGQTQETFVDILRIENSIDMWMKSLNELKKNISEGFEGEINMQSLLVDFFKTGSTDVAPKEIEVIQGELVEA